MSILGPLCASSMSSGWSLKPLLHEEATRNGTTETRTSTASTSSSSFSSLLHGVSTSISLLSSGVVCGCSSSGSLSRQQILEEELEKSQRPIDEIQTNKFVLRTKESVKQPYAHQQRRGTCLMQSAARVGGCTAAPPKGVARVTPSPSPPLHSSCTRFTPHFLRNPYISGSYRVYFTPLLAFRSLFRWHNETINIWTHLLPFFLFLIRGIQWLQQLREAEGERDENGHTIIDGVKVVIEPADFWMFLFFYGSLTTCMLWSSVYHLFGCCSYDTHRCLYRCDIGGILALIWGSYLPALFYSFRCRPIWQFGYSAVITVLVLTLLVLFNSLRCQQREFHSLRVGALVLTIAFAILPTFHWVFWIAPADFPTMDLWTFLLPLIGMIGAYAIGFGFYSKRIPEVYSPGRFDLIFQSHNWWHTWIVIAAIIWEAELKTMFKEKHMAIC